MTTRTRAAIVGTAESWRLTPWDDPTLHIVGLNDAYTLGFKRADEWYELHPLDHMWFRDPKDKVVDASKIPAGSYVRPHGHLEWLQAQAQTIPVWLQGEPPAGWPPNAQRLPIEALEAKYGAYWASGPAFELIHLYERGFREIHIYGIHLATDQERVDQRHNFEHLIGRLLGPEVTQTEKGALRIYEGATTGVRIVLPKASPILQHGWKYAYEPKPAKPVDPEAEEWRAVQEEKAALIKALIGMKPGPEKAKALARLQRVEVIEIDIQQMRAKRQIGGTLTCQIAA